MRGRVLRGLFGSTRRRNNRRARRLPAPVGGLYPTQDSTLPRRLWRTPYMGEYIRDDRLPWQLQMGSQAQRGPRPSLNRHSSRPLVIQVVDDRHL
ncbi:hypothetical protein SK128_018788 [Halocaridina rubra]|uniref:Uncharacterized protein n=1 Tax=Halocaridina rubra TaxID=373956 RepID=A0AAN8WVJ3_HALRR